PLFRRERVTAWFPIVTSEANRVVALWRGVAESNGEVDLNRDSTELARRVIARVVFGPDADRLRPVFAERLPYLSERAFNRGVSPIRIPDSWPTPGNRKAAGAKRVIREAVDGEIARRRREPTEGDDLLTLLLQAPDPEGGPGLDDGEVREQVFPYLLAGGDQPATAVAFVLHLLGHHPEAQRRVHEELDAVLGGRPLTPADIEALTYTTAVIKETMRLYPPAYGLPRRAEKEQRYRGYRIPAGSQTVSAPWVTHRHPAFWDEPGHFDPQRFTPEAEAARPPFAYFAFGGGPHGCVGVHLAMLETTVATATILQAYRVVTYPRKVSLTTGTTLRPKAAMPARVMAR
ncbi:MAG TPA: cytochrome P450, partial [Acidimicrobiales bacterium]|nr:cytochrome P450 [Acidimicrobiales bacterium]